MFIDETGFARSPSVEHTWARRGQTPTIKRSLRRDRLHVIDAVTGSGQFLSRTHTTHMRQPQIAQFLAHVLDWVAGPIIVVWDGARIHNVSNAIARFMSMRYGARVLECIKLPAYAPELNPAELAWRWLKSQGISNRSPSPMSDPLKSAYMGCADQNSAPHEHAAMASRQARSFCGASAVFEAQT